MLYWDPVSKPAQYKQLLSTANIFLYAVLGPGQIACTIQAIVVHCKYLPLCCTGTGQIACTIKAIVVHCKYLLLFCTGTQSDGPHNTGNIFLYSVLVPGQIACTIWGISSSMLYWYLARLPPQYGEYLHLFCTGTRSDSPHNMGNIFLYSVLVPGHIACTMWENLPLFCTGTQSDSPHNTGNSFLHSVLGSGQIACTIQVIVVHYKYLPLFCTGDRSDSLHYMGNIFLYSVLAPVRWRAQ